MSIVISFATGLDVLVLLKIDSAIPFIGTLLTGILLSRGANFMDDLFGKLSNVGKTSTSDVSLSSNVNS